MTPSTTINPSSDFGPRLVTLSDGRPGLRGGMSVTVHDPGKDAFHGSDGDTVEHVPTSQNGKDAFHCVPDSTKRSDGDAVERVPTSTCLDFISSDETLDRYDEIIMASGWKLANYQRNPVFQNAHQYGDILFTLGKSLITEVRAGKLFQRIEFATDVNPMAKIAYGLYKGKFLNAVSVGFIPLRWENGDGTGNATGKSPLPAACRAEAPSEGGTAERGEGRGEGLPSLSLDTRHSSPQQFRRRYLEQELLEVSAVGIPANPNALALGLKSGAIEKSDVQDLFDLLRCFCDSEFRVQGSKFKVQSSPSHDRQPIHLARQLRDVLRHT